VTNQSSIMGPCRLCGAVGRLKDNHVLSSWVFRPVPKFGPGLPPVLVEHGERCFTSPEESEHLLGECCERRVGEWEAHVSQLALRPDGASTAMRMVTLRASRVLNQEAEADGAALGDELGLFAASVVWRESARSKPRVTLGRYADEFKAFLLAGHGALEHARLMIHIVDKRTAPSASEVASYPAMFWAQGYREYQFAVAGMVFTFLVGASVPSRFDYGCYLRTKRVWVVDGHEMGRAAAQFQHVRPVIRMRAGSG